ncbi:SRPBCC family protein [Jiangella mangrovi]|uniref:Carbon monoxide dehydrogenase subunit G n=1 Tax=Jiangella mangrovi TaxID=1524084 RepID=A0A7W9GPN8_9ACTN|nr:carbon monoxide dehydrogenase subunit G [Jiangella mangrovi]
MTEAFHATTVIDQPADAVWTALTDWSRAADWMPGVEAVQAGGATAVGTELTVRARGKDRTSTITALDPGRSLTLTSVQGGVTADYAYTVEPSAGDTSESTTVMLAADVRTRGWWTMFGPLLRAAIRRADGGQLDAFRHAVTGAPGGTRGGTP